uniref:HMG box domain-containing protein n=1 Tax=Aegilops tauschii subsp. strangulata TaxID=200361 RepID=A0A452ZK11_AEGTS
MDNFRKEYKEKHPDVKQVSMIGKAGGEKWKSMSDAVLCSCTRLAPSPARWSFLRRPA